ncbi:RNA 2',3'-cyclic phosphodiesterase [Occallatibacter savannae]|uniref:RNA 2',3'-cyclic phosphodiesterase n=1 Tax=Occallatibacter savannae TaxID=1002691 RepID=UPI000D69155A|nr:RNA 2',3'-cyclic phosphodiesterase [Occallatibacter savannae]
MRLFVGIPLPAELLDSLDALVRRLRADKDGLRWSSPDTWHITLQFLGETTPEKFECLTACLAQIRAVPVPIRLDNTGVFAKAGVFWAGVTVSPELRLLHKAVCVATASCGVQSDDRPYRPHVTLARAKSGSASVLRNLQHKSSKTAKLPGFIATEFFLYESRLGQGGAKHEVRQRFPLAPL